MSKAAKLIYVAFVTYLLISMNFSPRVNAQTPAPFQLSCQNIPKPSIIVYSPEPFKPKKGSLEKGNAFLLYAIKDLKEITLEVKGLKDNNWEVIETVKGTTNSIANRIPNTNEISIKETGEYIIQTKGGDEELELKAVDNSATVNKVDNKKDLFIKIDSMKSKILQTQSYILGLLRKGYEADQIIYDALDKAIKDTQASAPASPLHGLASLSITGRQVDVDTAQQSVKNAKIFLLQKGGVKIPLGADFNQQIEVTCSSPGSTTKILSQTLHQDNSAFWSQVITKAQHIREVVAEPVEKGVGYVEKGEKLFSAFKVTITSDDAIPQTFVVRVPNSDTAVGVDVINSIKLAQDYGVAPKLIKNEPIPVKLQCKVGGANVKKSYNVLAEEFVEGEYAANALASPTPKFSEYEVYRAIGEADGRLWVNTETTVNGEPRARLLTDINLATIKVFRESGIVVVKYTDVEKVETTGFGSRLNSAGLAGKKLEFYLEGFIRQFSNEEKVKFILESTALSPIGTEEFQIVNSYLNGDLTPYLKPSTTKPITAEDVSTKAKELYEKRRRLYDVKVDDFSELSDEKLIEIIGGRDAVDSIVQDLGHASDYESYKQKNAGEARKFLLDRASYEHNQYGPFSTDAYLYGNGLNPIKEDAQNFDSKWGPDEKKYLKDLSADQARKELELQNQVRNFEGTRDLQIFKQIRDQLAKEHRNLYKVESFVEKQERLVQSLYETTPLDFFEQRLTDLDGMKKHYVETFPTGPAGSRVNVVLDQVGEFQSLLNDAKDRIQKGEPLGDYHTKVVDLADRIDKNYEKLSQADQETFRSFVDLVEETVDSVDEDQIRTALSSVDEEKLKAANKIAEETQKAIDKLPDDARNSAPIKKAMSRYKELVEKTKGKLTKENYAPILKQLSMIKQMVSSTKNANINARNSLITKSAIKLKIPLFDRFKVEIEHRFTTNPVISGANGYLETAKTFFEKRQAVVDQTRKLISEEGFEGRFSRYGGTFSLGLVGVISASPILKQYAQLSGNMYALRAAYVIDGVSYGLIGSTAVAELWLTLKAAGIIKTGLPTALRFASISLQGFRAFAKTTLITIVISEAINLIAMSVLANIYESCSADKNYGSSQLVLEKNVVNPDDAIKFMVYGTQRCDISQLSLVKKTTSIEPDFLVGSGEKICAFDTNGCCVGVSRVVAPPGTYTVKAVSGGHTFLSESTEGQPFTIKGKDDFVIFRSSMRYDSVRDSIQFSYANNLDSDALVVFYITDDKSSFYITNKKGKLVNQLPRISLPLKKHTTSADLGNYEEELGLKEVVKGNFVIAWAAYKTNDGKTPNLTPLDLSYPNEALKIQVK